MTIFFYILTLYEAAFKSILKAQPSPVEFSTLFHLFTKVRVNMLGFYACTEIKQKKGSERGRFTTYSIKNGKLIHVEFFVIVFVSVN